MFGEVGQNTTGIIHTDMYFPDGCSPSIATAAQFLDVWSDGVLSCLFLQCICCLKSCACNYFDLLEFAFMLIWELEAVAVDQVVERANGLVAVHCRAGLGRTGTLIALYLMKHLCFTAEQVQPLVDRPACITYILLLLMLIATWWLWFCGTGGRMGTHVSSGIDRWWPVPLLGSHGANHGRGKAK